MTFSQLKYLLKSAVLSKITQDLCHHYRDNGRHFRGIEDVDPEMKEKFKELLKQNLAAVKDLEKKQKDKKEEEVRYFVDYDNLIALSFF